MTNEQWHHLAELAVKSWSVNVWFSVQIWDNQTLLFPCLCRIPLKHSKCLLWPVNQKNWQLISWGKDTKCTKVEPRHNYRKHSLFWKVSPSIKQIDCAWREKDSSNCKLELTVPDLSQMFHPVHAVVWGKSTWMKTCCPPYDNQEYTMKFKHAFSFKMVSHTHLYDMISFRWLVRILPPTLILKQGRVMSKMKIKTVVSFSIDEG